MRRLTVAGTLVLAVAATVVVGARPAASSVDPDRLTLAGDGPASATPTASPEPTSVESAPAGPGIAPAAAPASVQPLHVVALGDSVPSADKCECAGFVRAYADQLSHTSGQRVILHNHARGSATTSTVRDQLRSRKVRRQLANATTVVIMVGANDYLDAFRAVGRGDAGARAYRPVEDRVAANLTAVINKVRALHTGSGALHIAVLDYWNVVKDGAVARRVYNHRQRAAATAATASANRAIARAVAATSTTEVSTFAPFESPQADLTALLAADGDHPSAAGHRLIATVLFQALPQG